ncbi:MAG TPA: hypothetical protein ENI95_03155 [Chloroflexi bacterium]|nr:hypothetical protein [Chloroflexota bacterium]
MDSDLIGRKLGPYEIVEFISSGGMAEVYKGYHPDLDRYVAIKIVGRHLQSDPVFNARFRREAKAIAQLRHPNIVQVYDFGAAEGGHYMVMEYVEGITLADLLDQVRAGERTLEMDDVIFIIRQIAAALDHAHKKGVIHRDVKPGNILITRSGQAILTDFGLALLRSRNAEDDSSGSAFGTPEYMAPEQISDSRAAGPASDIYSLGVVLYEMVTGEVPFRADSVVDTALRHLNENAPDPRLLNPDLPEGVAQVILKALAKSPRDRYRRAVQMALELEQAYATPEEVSATQELPSSGPPTQQSVPTRVMERPAAEPTVVVRRRPSKRQAWREKRRLRAEHRAARRAEKLQRQREKRVLREAERLARRQRRRRRLTRLVRTAVVLLVLGLLIASAVYMLQTLGVISISVRWPGAAVAVEETASPVPPTETPTPTFTPVPTETPVPTATPLQAVAATPVPPIVFAPLEAGSSAYRIHDGGVMQFIPAGTFLMGTDDLNRNRADQPQHPVYLSDYWIDRTEVTNAQYALCVDEGLCQPPITRRYFDDPEYADYPVAFIRYESAVAYCLWLAGQANQIIGLPTEAQWEKAAAWDPVNEVARRYPWGDEPPTPELMRYAESRSARPAAPVGSYPAGASAYGVLDMAGNVWEWVADWFDPDYYRRTGIATDPAGPPSGTARVTRGGSWSMEGRYALSSLRNPTPATAYGEDIGFRCAMTASRPPAESGILLTPLDTVEAFVALLEEAREKPENDRATLDEWTAALEDLRGALQSGDHERALSLIDERLERLTGQRDSGLLSDRLALQLRNGLRWMREQVAGG